MMRVGGAREPREPPMPILSSEALTRTYVSGGREIAVLKNITFDLPTGGFLAIAGPSGSGKSTLLGLLAGLDRPTSGRVLLDGHDLSTLTEDERARLRAERVGFVFQSFHLIPTLTARENIQAILDRAKQQVPPPRLVLLAMEALPNYGEDYRRRFREIYPALARTNGAVLIPFLLEGVAGVPSLNQADGIHPTAEGHRRLAETVWKTLRPLLS